MSTKKVVILLMAVIVVCLSTICVDAEIIFESATLGQTGYIYSS